MVCWPNPLNRHDGCGGVEKEQVDVKGDSWEVESRTHGTKSRWELDAFLSAESRGAFMSSSEPAIEIHWFRTLLSEIHNLICTTSSWSDCHFDISILELDLRTRYMADIYGVRIRKRWQVHGKYPLETMSGDCN